MLPILYNLVILLSLGMLCGLMNILIGFGGGFFVVPSLCFLLPHLVQVSPDAIIKLSIGTSLLVMLLNTTSVVFRFHRENKIQWERGNSYLLPISIGALSTLSLVHELSSSMLKISFVAYLGITIILNFRRFIFSNIHNEQNDWRPSTIWKYIFGILTGASASLLGVGGSVLTVPHFRKQGLHMQHAVPLATLLTWPLSLLGAASYMIIGWHDPVMQDLPFSFGYVYIPAVCAIFLGTQVILPYSVNLAGRIDSRTYDKAYMLMLIVVLIMMVFS